MKKMSILILMLILAFALLTKAEARGKSVSFRVSCVVPERLELSVPTDERIEGQKPESPTNLTAFSSKIQTQEIRIRGAQKEIIYTIIER